MDYFFANSEIFRLQAILHDATGSLKSNTYKGPCFVIFHLDFQVFAFLFT